MKRKNSFSNDDHATKKRKIDQSEPRTFTVEHGPTIADLPLEIIGDHIFKFFQFHYWLKNFVLVNKQWNKAAIHSNAQKQLIIRPRAQQSGRCDIEPVETAMHYQITELFIYDIKITPSALVLLLQASKKLTLVALYKCFPGFDSARKYQNITFPNITTVFVPNDLLKHFPNAYQVKLFDSTPINQTFPKVTELVLPKSTGYGSDSCVSTLRPFTNVKKVYIFNDSASIDLLQLRENFPSMTLITTSDPVPYHHRFFMQSTSPLFASLRGYDDCDEDLDRLLKLTSWEYEVDLHSRVMEYSFPYFSVSSLGQETRSESDLESEIYYNNCGVVSNWQTFFPTKLVLQILVSQRSTRNIEEILLNNFSALQRNVNPKYFLVIALRILGEERVMQLFSEKAIRTIINDNPDHSSILTYYKEYPIEIRLLAPLIDDWSDDTIVDSAISNSNLDDAIKFIQNGAKVHIDRLFGSPGSTYAYMVLINEEVYEFNKLAWTDVIKSIVTHEASSVPIEFWLFESDWYKAPPKILDVLVELGADINAQQRFLEEFKGGSLYNWLVYNNANEDILEHLTSKYGVNPGLVDSRGQTALSMAISFAPNKIKYLLNKHGEHFDLQNGFVAAMTMYLKSDTEYIDIIDSFLSNGADINAFGRSFHSTVDRTPLLEALHCRRSPNVIKYLLLQGARTDLVTSEGDTVLHLVIESYGDMETIISLIKYGADVNRVAHRCSISPLILTAQCNSDHIAYYLLLHGADITCCDIEGQSYFHHLLVNPIELYFTDLIELIVTKHRQLFIDKAKDVIQLLSDEHDAIQLFVVYSKFMAFIDLTKILIEEIGVDVNTRCSATGRSLLALAAKFEVVEYLIAQGIDVNMQDKYGESALMLVIKDKVRCHEKERFIKLLLDNGADVHLKNRKNLSCIDMEPNIMKYKQ